MVRLAHSPVMPTWPQVVKSAALPHLRVADMIASTWVIDSPLMGLSLLTYTASASMATGTGVGL